MAELWKNLIAQEDEGLANQLTLSRVSISKNTGQMRVKFASDKILNDTQFNFGVRRTNQGKVYRMGEQ